MKQFKHFTANSNEKIYMIVHRHWFNIFRQYIPIILLLTFTTIVIIILLVLTTNEESAINNSSFNNSILYLIGIAVYLIAWIYGFFIWVDYHLDIWIVTSSRIVNIEQKGFFSRTVSELDYSHIQDVTSNIEGILHTALNYGDVNIQTAGTHGHFIFRNIPKPEKMKTLVMHLHRQALTKKTHPTYTQKEKEIQKND